MRYGLLTLLLFLAQPQVGAAADPGLESQRAAFRTAWVAAERGDWRSVEPLLGDIGQYPLLPDLQAVYLRATIARQPDEQVAQFLESNAALWISPSLRSRWIHAAAKRGDWERFLEIYRSHYAEAGNRDLDCLAARAMANSGDAAGFVDAAQRLWLVGFSQPKTCDPVFATLKKNNLLTPQLIGARLDLALAAEQFGLASYLAGQLDDAQRRRVKRWRNMRDAPETELERVAAAPIAAAQIPWVVYGLDRLARHDPDLSARLLPRVSAVIALDPAEHDRLTRKTALWSARKYLPAGLDRIRALPQSARDDEIAVAWARAALRAEDWDDVLTAIAAMEAATADDSTWQFWRARALNETGDRNRAEPIFEALARERGYHSFLAADRLDLPYTFSHAPAIADEPVIEAIAGRSDFVRARELFAVGLDSGGRIEWQRALAGLDRHERGQAAILAHRWGWHSRAIAAASANGFINDLEIRFPAPYQELFERHSPAANVAVSWAYGITRSESLFMRDVSSPAGAIGLMQLMPATGAATARELNLPYAGRGSLVDPQVNITLGTSYLGKMLARFDGNQVVATAAYNAGPHRVDAWLPESGNMAADVWVETIPFRETRSYVKRVLAAETVFLWRLNGSTVRLSERMPAVRARADASALTASGQDATR